MHDTLNAFFDLALAEVHRVEGTINQFLGDGFMALFGAPLAHEDHVRRALLSALAIRLRLEDAAAGDSALLAPVRVRMGVNTGTVVVGRIGDNLRMDYTAIGDTTNLAARLQQHAAPGSICVSDAVRAVRQQLLRVQLPRLAGVEGHRRDGRAVRARPGPRPRGRCGAGAQPGRVVAPGRARCRA